MEQLKYLLEKEISKDWIEKHLWLSEYNQNKLLGGEEIKKSAKRLFNINAKAFIEWFEEAHMEDVL